ncbi:flagellar transcriptional regulator FlhC [Pseudomonas serbica]|jgi:flagellar transcriptional activator FlhC|uniref:flagellar transcriptional regulator FlhC n=1 Tax=Pseudomonas serbica TaxID=2965074 RepID=UPI00237B1BB6|nr:flagellar transcriptional regulator FlhC [Pseudomonas serbica]
MTDQPRRLLDEYRDVQKAIELINLGARLQVVESEVLISRPKLIRLYKELQGQSPPKGLLPFSTEWFLTWQPNMQASLFYGIFQQMQRENPTSERLDLFISAYQLYREQVQHCPESVALGITRVWTLLRFFESKQLDLAVCTRCDGRFIVHTHSPVKQFVCGICQPPSRAGKRLKKANKDVELT